MPLDDDNVNTAGLGSQLLLLVVNDPLRVATCSAQLGLATLSLRIIVFSLESFSQCSCQAPQSFLSAGSALPWLSHSGLFHNCPDVCQSVCDVARLRV